MFEPFYDTFLMKHMHADVNFDQIFIISFELHKTDRALHPFYSLTVFFSSKALIDLRVYDILLPTYEYFSCK